MKYLGGAAIQAVVNKFILNKYVLGMKPT